MGKALRGLGFKEGAALQAQFVAQPSRYVQPLVVVADDYHRGKAEHVEGESVQDSFYRAERADRTGLAKQTWMQFNRYAIIKHMARAYADLVGLGTTHGDPHIGNLIMNGERDAPLSFIDYGPNAVSPLEEDYVDMLGDGLRYDFRKMKLDIRAFFARDDKSDLENLSSYFDREFEKAISRMAARDEAKKA